MACLLAAAPAASNPTLGAVGAAAVFVLVVGLSLARPSAVPWAIAGLGAEYAISLGGGLDGRVPLYAVGLLVTAELSYWSLQLRRGAADEPGMAERRIIGLLVAATAALLAGAMLVAVARVPFRGGLAVEAIGLAAAIGALALILALARRPSVH